MEYDEGKGALNSDMFELLDVSGTEEIFDYNPSLNILCYSIGCIIGYWDLKNDKKLFVKYHTSFIKNLKFTKNGKFLISIDELARIVLWEIPSLKIYLEYYVPIFTSSSINLNAYRNLHSNSDSFFNSKSDSNFSSIGKGVEYANSGAPKIFTNFFNQNSKVIKEIFLEFLPSDDYNTNSNSNERFCIFTNKDEKQKFFLFEFSTNKISPIDLIFETAIYLDSNCLDLKIFSNFNLPNITKEENKNCYNIVILEENFLKIFHLNEAEFKISLKIKIKTKQKSRANTLQICESLKLINFINIDGYLIVLDFNGNFLISLSPSIQEPSRVSSSEIFLTSKIEEESLFVTSSYGNLFLFDLNGFKTRGIIEYDSSNLKNPLLSSLSNKLDFKSYNIRYSYTDNKIINRKENDTNPQYNLDKIMLKGPPLIKIFINQKEDFLIRRFSDNSLVFSKFSYTQSQTSIVINTNNNCVINYGFSHFKPVTDIIWLKSLDDPSQIPSSFLTCSEDQSIIGWSYTANNLVNNHLDLLKTYDNTLNNWNYLGKENFSDSRFQINEERTNFFLQILEFHPVYPKILVAGDNMGYLHIFYIEDFSFNNSKGNFLRPSRNEKINQNSYKKYSIGNFAINYLSFSHNGNFMSIGFETGQVVLADFTNDCSICLILEDHFNDNRFLNLKKVENRNLSLGHIFKLKLPSLNEGNSKIPQSSSNFYYQNNSEINLRILTMHNLNSFHVQIVTKEKTKFLRTKFKEIITRNKIQKAQVHCSEDYVLVSYGSVKSIDIYRIETGEIVGEIKIDGFIYDFKMDPSGLYVALLINECNLNVESVISTTKNNSLMPLNENFPDLMNSNRYKVENNLIGSPRNILINDTHKSSIVFYEVATGNFVTIISNLYEISSFKFSNDGKFFSIATDSGCISIWELPHHMSENILSVLTEIKENNKLWDLFRINYVYTTGDRGWRENFINLDYKSNEENLLTKSQLFSHTNFYSNTKMNSVNQNFYDNYKKEDENKFNSYNDNDNFKENFARNEDPYNNNQLSSTHNINSEHVKTYNNKENFCSSKNSSKGSFLKGRTITANINKSLQTSFVNRDVFKDHQKRKEKEWDRFHKYERIYGFKNENYRVINKDPSIYPRNVPSVVKNDDHTKKFSFTQINLPVPNLRKSRIEDLSKTTSDMIRRNNIEKAMEELEKSPKKSEKEDKVINSISNLNSNSNLDRSRLPKNEEKKKKHPDILKEDIVTENCPPINLDKSIQEQEIYLNDKINQFDKMHEFK